MPPRPSAPARPVSAFVRRAQGLANIVARPIPGGVSRKLSWPRFGVLALATALAVVPLSQRQDGPLLLLDPGLSGSMGISPSQAEGADPVQFSASELKALHQRFGVHGSQPRLAQLFTAGIDQLQPLRSYTLGRIQELQPLIVRESKQRHVNPMLVAAVLFDEMRHAKPGENLPIAAHSGLFQTHGPAQLGVDELIHQGLLPPRPSDEQISQARDRLLDPDQNVILLIGKFARLSKELRFPQNRLLQASGHPRDAKALATLAYLHNGKLDYPRRILRAMQDPELHAVIYGLQQAPATKLI